MSNNSGSADYSDYLAEVNFRITAEGRRLEEERSQKILEEVRNYFQENHGLQVSKYLYHILNHTAFLQLSCCFESQFHTCFQNFR